MSILNDSRFFLSVCPPLRLCSLKYLRFYCLELKKIIQNRLNSSESQQLNFKGWNIYEVRLQTSSNYFWSFRTDSVWNSLRRLHGMVKNVIHGPWFTRFMCFKNVDIIFFEKIKILVSKIVFLLTLWGLGSRGVILSLPNE